jgi:hypothetical protein
MYEREIIYISDRLSPLFFLLLPSSFLLFCVHLTDSIWVLRVASKRTLWKFMRLRLQKNGNQLSLKLLLLLFPLLAGHKGANLTEKFSRLATNKLIFSLSPFSLLFGLDFKLISY